MADEAIAALERTRQEIAEDCERRLAAIDTALAALRGEDVVLRRRPQVGPDKIEAVRTYIRKVKKARQSDIVRATGFNSGTVSTALQALQLDGEVEAGTKVDRSRMWVAK